MFRSLRVLGIGAAIFAVMAITATNAAAAAAQDKYDYEAPEPGTYELPPIKAAGDGMVLGTDGNACRLLDLMKGRLTVMSFIYTRCRDPRACPFATGVLYEIYQASKSDPVIAEQLQLLTFSFDPDNDTPTVMAEYGASLGPEKDGCDWRFLTTSGVKELEPILESYGQRVDRKRNPDDPLGPFYHVLRVFLIDGSGMIRNIYSFGFLDPRLLMADIRTLLLEENTQASIE